MSFCKRVAVIGVGLIGGSIGLAVQNRQIADQVVGIGRNPAKLRKARRLKTVTSTTVDLGKGVAEADLVVVCTPVQWIVPFVKDAARHCRPGTLITDAGSTKAEIVNELSGCLPPDVAFVGSHPLAGSEKAGAEFARHDLLDGRTVVVTPDRRTKSADFERIARFWQLLGATVERMSPTLHDQMLAASSHLPHAIASLLAAATPTSSLPFAATGWRDATRIAAGDVELWKQIFASNRTEVLNALDKFSSQLDQFRAALRDEDFGRIARILRTGKQRRDAVDDGK